MFAGAVYSGAAPLRIGVVDPSAGPCLTGGIDELSISVTEPPPPTIHASIYIPQSPDPEVAGTIHYFHGLRDATATDPGLSEAATETASLVFGVRSRVWTRRSPFTLARSVLGTSGPPTRPTLLAGAGSALRSRGSLGSPPPVSGARGSESRLTFFLPGAILYARGR